MRWKLLGYLLLMEPFEQILPYVQQSGEGHLTTHTLTNVPSKTVGMFPMAGCTKLLGFPDWSWIWCSSWLPCIQSTFDALPQKRANRKNTRRRRPGGPQPPGAGGGPAAPSHHSSGCEHHRLHLALREDRGWVESLQKHVPVGWRNTCHGYRV